MMKILIVPALATSSLAATNCNGRDFELSIDNWKSINADQSLRAFWNGGKDGEGVS